MKINNRMKINDIINKLKNDYHGHYWNERLIDEETTRDKVLYGSTELECTWNCYNVLLLYICYRAST